MESDDLIKVPVEQILKDYECPICLTYFEEPCITPCGHTFCGSCLEECINLVHECPHCRSPCTMDKIAKNFFVESSLKALLEQKEIASKQYFDTLINTGLERSNSTGPRNPIEVVFQANIRESLFSFETYYEDLQNKFRKNSLKLSRQGAPAESIAELEDRFKRSVDVLVQAYDKHMKELAPSPLLLPLRVYIKVPSKNVTIDTYIPRTHTSKDLQQLLLDHFEAAKNPVTQFGPGVFIAHSAVGDNPQTLEDPLQPIATLELPQGSSIEYQGTILTKADAPKKCVTYKFSKEDAVATNYYSCVECKLNWICEECSRACHVGHRTSIAVPNHVPTWACCNCTKKGNCQLPNKRTQ